MTLSYRFFGLLFCLIFYKVEAQKSVLDEFNLSDDIKTVTLYAYSPEDKYRERYLNPPVVNLQNSQQKLFLEFDDLKARFSQYRVKIIHCNIDWTPSDLLDMEFLPDINEYYINDFQVSQNTKTPYYHYRYILQKPKISGNFVIQLFENDNLVLQKKFWVYENAIDVSITAQGAQDPEYWKTHQQINLQLNLGNLRVGIPQRDLVLILMQNQNKWLEINNKDLISNGLNKFALQHFDNKYLFPAGNEFRYIDLSSTFRKGQNVQQIILGRPDEIISYPQINRGKLNFADSYDNDGGYIVSTIEQGDQDIVADYANVIFRLAPFPISEGSTPILIGGLTDWHPMNFEFNPESGFLECAILLKNGVYDYLIGIKNLQDLDLNLYEGDFYQTHNTYEVFVYYNSPGQRFPKLIGYQLTKTK